MMFPSQMTREQMAQLLQLQQNQLTLLQMQYGQDNPGLPLIPQPIQPPMSQPVMAQPAANDPWKEKFDLMAARVKKLEQKENERLTRYGEEPRHETGSTPDPPPESVEPKPPTQADPIVTNPSPTRDSPPRSRHSITLVPRKGSVQITPVTPQPSAGTSSPVHQNSTPGTTLGEPIRSESSSSRQRRDQPKQSERSSKRRPSPLDPSLFPRIKKMKFQPRSIVEGRGGHGNVRSEGPRETLGRVHSRDIGPSPETPIFQLEISRHPPGCSSRQDE